MPRSLICKSNANTYQFSNGLINARPVFFEERATNAWNRVLREGGGDLYGPRFQPTSISITRKNSSTMRPLCSSLGVKKNGGGTEEERIGRGKYRHLVNTCTSRAGPSRVREGCLSSSSSSMFFFLSLSFSFTFVHAYRYVAMYSTRFIPSFSFPSPPSPRKTHKLEVSLLYTFPSILFESMIFHRPGIRIFFFGSIKKLNGD